MSIPRSNNPDLLAEMLSAKRVLFVGAHPDDIEFYCGGFVYYLRKAGVEVTFLIGTRGGKGRKGRSGERLKALRTQHQIDSARILGGALVEFCDYPDKLLSQSIEQFSCDIKAIIDRTKPEFVFCWDPDYIFNPHPDHQAAAYASHTAACKANATLMYYGTRLPDMYIGLDAEAYHAKIQSLRAHRTETPWYYWILLSKRLRKKLMQSGAQIECKYAEELRSKV